jgi:anti-sigma B factor antagonist
VKARGPLVISPEGELDFASVGAFRDALAEAAGPGEAGVLVDLSEVSFIDSSGLGALVELHNRLRRDNRQLAVVAPGGTAAAVLLNLSGLSNRLRVYETRPEGVPDAG